MEIIKKYKMLLVLALLVIVGVFFFFSRMYHNDIKALEDFMASYQKFDKAISDFSIPVFASNLEGAPALDQFNKIYSQITASMQDTRPNGDRLALAKEAISLNNQLLDCLNKTDDLESKTGDALIELNQNASARISSLIKNDGQLMSTALEIADLSKKELDNLSAYKRAIWDKRDITNKLLQNIIDDNGGLNGFIKLLSQKDNQAKIKNQNADLDRLGKEFGALINNRTTAYARFQGLGPDLK
ncbi:MAG: hypothetical protein AAB037_06645 [Chloroflexota bacterium]